MKNKTTITAQTDFVPKSYSASPHLAILFYFFNYNDPTLSWPCLIPWPALFDNAVLLFNNAIAFIV
jgi:hypothetical protein